MPFLKDSLRRLASSILPMSVTKNPDNMAVPPSDIPMAIIIWVELVMALLCPWNNNSKIAWSDLLGYRIEKACLCKNLNGSEHEFILVDLANEDNQNLRLRVERAVGEKNDSRTASASSSMTSFESCSELSSSSSLPRPASPSSAHQSKFSKLSRSLSSVNESISKASGSLERAVRRLSDTSLPRPSVIISNRHSAADTVTNINSFPKNAKIIRTIDFNSVECAQRPSLWDLMIISYVVHQDSVLYDLFGRQCFWFADTILAILEKWSERCKSISVKQGKNATRAYFFKLHTNPYSSGGVKGFSIHQRNLDDIEKIWTQFLKQREEMDWKRQSYEDTMTEGSRKTEELAGQVEELKQQQAQEKQKWELERMVWEAKERLLMKEQEEWERRLKDQIAEQERVQQRLQQRLWDNDRRFQEIDEKFKLLDDSKN